MRDTKVYISKEELRSHNKKDDLWISIKGKIYNVSDWANHHQGGELPLLYFGGEDATDVFLSYHPRSSWRLLDQFFVGYYLEQYEVSEISKDYKRLLDEFEKTGRFQNKGHGSLIWIFLLLIMFSLSVYGVLTSNNFRVHLACGGLLGFAWIQLGWVAHDSAHYQVMINSRFNNFAQFVFLCFNGISFVWWKREHNAHHIACNSLEFDPNAQFMPVFAASPHNFTSLTSYFYKKKMSFNSLSRFLITHQLWTFFPIITFLRTYFYALSFSLLLSKEKVANRAQDLVGMLVFWMWFSLLVSCLPDWFERIAFVTITIAVTGIQSFQFTLSHITCDAYIGPLKGGDWLKNQIIGSLDIACSPWMDWFHGGLQFQVEHHLFPRMPRSQLRNISPYVQQLCKKHNLPYQTASFWDATKLLLKTLGDASLQARNFAHPATMPKDD